MYGATATTEDSGHSKNRGLSFPLQDIHEDHHANSLPSPTPCLSVKEGFGKGHWVLKREWPIHPYEIDAVKAVSTYAQKFGRNCIFESYNRLPSPTNFDDGDISGKFFISSLGIHQIPPETTSVEKLSAVHSYGLQTGESMKVDQSLTETATLSTPTVIGNLNIQRQDHQTEKISMLMPSISAPDIFLPFNESLKGLIDSVSQASLFQAALYTKKARRTEEQRKMFVVPKLSLVLDLDHTLLDSAKFDEVDPVHDDILKRKEVHDNKNTRRHLFKFSYMGMWIKLRPGIWNFLEKASKLCELHLCTKGNKFYAEEIAKLLDPSGELFAGRVFSRDDNGNELPEWKHLERVLDRKSAVLVIDSSVKVWPCHKLNLIVVERYMYFPSTRRQLGLPGPSLFEVNHDESEKNGTLASSLAVIKRIHHSFLSHQPLDKADVRIILASEQKKILAGCCILFSGISKVGETNLRLHRLWQTAQQFGAVCTNKIDEQVTHVVANLLGTHKVKWAISTGRFVVHPGWVEASRLLYRRANERHFAIKENQHFPSN